VSLNLREMDADFGVLPFPKLDSAQRQHWSATSPHFHKFLWLPTTNEDLPKTANIIQALGYYGQQTVIPAVWETTVTHKTLRDDESLEMLDIIMSNRVYDLGVFYNWGDILGMYTESYGVRQNNLASAFEARRDRIETEMQATVDQLMGY